MAGARDALDATDAVDHLVPPATPLRRPHSPSVAKLERKEPAKQDENDHDRQNNKVNTSPGQTNQRNLNNVKRGGRTNNYNGRDNAYNNRDNANNGRDNAYNNRDNLNNSRDNAYNNRDNANNRENLNNSRDNANNGRDNANNARDKMPFDRRQKQTGDEDTWKIVNNATRSDPKPAPAEAKPAQTPAPPQESIANRSASAAKNASAANNSASGANVPVKKPGNVSDVTPTKKFAPKNYVIEMLPIGETALLSVDSVTSSCATNKPGFVCLSMHDKFEADYQVLCETYVVDCEADASKIEPSPGDLFSYLSPEDGGWYRARSLGNAAAALIDSSKTIKLQPSDVTKKLAGKYEAMPEFSCVLDCPKVKVGDNLKCTLVAKTADGFKVSIESIDTGAAVGEGTITRWLPDVAYPPPPVAAAPQPPVIPEVPRPDVANNTTVYLVDITAADKAYVRPADTNSAREYDQLLQDVYMHATTATPLTEPPKKGDVVIAKFIDGFFYRALCKRTNVAQNKYLLEYIDFGNAEIAKLENLYPCPSQFWPQQKRTLSTLVSLQVGSGPALTAPATSYLDGLKDSSAELMLTIPTGAKTAGGGAPVVLTVVKNNECVNKKVEEMCTPDWKKMEDKGKDVLETPKLIYENIKYLDLPPEGCELVVLDFGTLKAGSVSGHERGLPRLEAELAKLTERMTEYCNSEVGRAPYLPSVEELCIAQCPPYDQWYRAVVLEHRAGEPAARLLYIDYGNLQLVPVTMLRKMLPEFAAQPALAIHIDIKGFPEDPTDDMLARALAHMRVDDEGRGVLKTTRCIKTEPGLYTVEAAELIKAMTS